MSNTISLLTGIQHTRTSPQAPVNVQTQTTNITQSGNIVFTDTPTIATSATTITTGSISTLGLVVLENLDSANFVKIAVDDGGTPKYWGKIKAGERFIFRAFPGTTIKAIADTASVKLQVTIYED